MTPTRPASQLWSRKAAYDGGEGGDSGLFVGEMPDSASDGGATSPRSSCNANSVWIFENSLATYIAIFRVDSKIANFG